MGRAPCCSKVGLHRGPWTPREDALLTKYIQAHGEGQWRSLPKRAGLLRCGKSCRLRWMNYLRPDIKRGNITPEEDDLIIRMHSLLGNRWSLIAGRLPGRTDNEIKNYWNTHLTKKLRNQGTDPTTHNHLLIMKPPPHQQPPNNSSKIINYSSNKKKKKKKKKNNNNNISSSSSRKKNKSDDRGAKVETQKTVVYLPKAIRVGSLSSSSSSYAPSNLTLESNSSTREGEKELKVVWGEGFGFLGGEDDELINGYDEMECQSSGDYGSLEKLYEEYLQLLNMEDNHQHDDSFSFAQSLLL